MIDNIYMIQYVLSLTQLAVMRMIKILYLYMCDYANVKTALINITNSSVAWKGARRCSTEEHEGSAHSLFCRQGMMHVLTWHSCKLLLCLVQTKAHAKRSLVILLLEIIFCYNIQEDTVHGNTKTRGKWGGAYQDCPSPGWVISMLSQHSLSWCTVWNVFILFFILWHEYPFYFGKEANK